MIEIEEDHIAIYDTNYSKDEIVRWVSDEWEEDPDVVVSIANAIHLYHTKGPDYLKMLLEESYP